MNFLLGINLIIYKKIINIPPKTRRIKIKDNQYIFMNFKIIIAIKIVVIIIDISINIGWLNKKNEIIGKIINFISENSI